MLIVVLIYSLILLDHRYFFPHTRDIRQMWERKSVKTLTDSRQPWWWVKSTLAKSSLDSWIIFLTVSFEKTLKKCLWDSKQSWPKCKEKYSNFPSFKTGGCHDNNNNNECSTKRSVKLSRLDWFLIFIFYLLP